MKIVSFFFGLNRKFQLQASHRFKIRNNNTHARAHAYTHSDVIVVIALPRCDWMWELSVQCTQPDLC